MNDDIRKMKRKFIPDNSFSCAVCRKVFVRKVSLKSHIRKTKHSVTKQWPIFIKTIVPQEWPYNIISFNKNGSHYRLKFLLPTIVSINQLKLWMENFIRFSHCVYIRVGRKKNRSNLTPYSEFYRCQHFHKRKNDKKRSKGTGCKSTITASIKCDFSSAPYYTVIGVNFIHNHSIHSGETLRFRKPSAEVENVFKHMLEDGFSPAHALRNFMTHLEFLPSTLYLNSITDRTKCPDYNWVHHFYEWYNMKIPLGIIITTQETLFVIEKGLRLFSLMTDENSFGGRGEEGPISIMTDNVKTEMKALKLVFPKSSLFWSTFHFLKTIYNWLLNSKYHINKEDISYLYSAIKKLVYSITEENLEVNYKNIIQLFSHNLHLINYLKNLYNKKNKWALCYRTSFLRNVPSCCSSVEREMQVLKEQMLHLLKTQSPCDLIQYFIEEYDSFYKKKLMDNYVDLNHSYFTNRFINKIEGKHYICGAFLNAKTLYYVYNKLKKTKYIVNTDIGSCTCYIGVTGNFCKHQRLLIGFLSTNQDQKYPFIIEFKIDLYYIATGNNETSLNFFHSLQNVNAMETDTQYAMEVILKSDDTSDSSYMDEIEQNLDNHIVEEILIEVKDEIDIEKLNYAKTDLIKSLKNYFHALIMKLRKDEQYYEKGIVSMYKELQKLKELSSSYQLDALYSFNGNYL